MFYKFLSRVLLKFQKQQTIDLALDFYTLASNFWMTAWKVFAERYKWPSFSSRQRPVCKRNVGKPIVEFLGDINQISISAFISCLKVKIFTSVWRRISSWPKSFMEKIYFTPWMWIISDAKNLFEIVQRRPFELTPN